MINIKKETKKKINSTVYNRIHINSINMSHLGLLTSGGIGFSIKYAPIEIEVFHQDVNDNIIEGYESVRIESIMNNLHSKYKIPNNGWTISIKKKLKSHIGLGSTTQIEAQIVSSLLLYHDDIFPTYQDFIENEIGIESGIGLKCFLKNGFHIDFGYWNDSKKNTILNSSDAVEKSLSFKLPPTWEVLLIIPKEYRSICGKEENEFLKSIIPVNNLDVYKISFTTLMGLIPAILENDFKHFMESLNIITKLGTKSQEIKLNQKYINNMFADVTREFGFCALSSLGPTCYTFIENVQDRSEGIADLKNKHQDFEFIITELAYD